MNNRQFNAIALSIKPQIFLCFFFQLAILLYYKSYYTHLWDNQTIVERSKRFFSTLKFENVMFVICHSSDSETKPQTAHAVKGNGPVFCPKQGDNVKTSAEVVTFDWIWAKPKLVGVCLKPHYEWHRSEELNYE